MRLRYERWSTLAAIRFSLASFVVFTHLGAYTSSPVVGFLGSAAFEAILGFLVISGYSIGSSYSSRPKGFYVRRIERIYPAYIAALILNVIAVGAPGFGVLIANVVFLNQIATRESFLGPAWSLSLEVWLYVLTPLIMRFTPRRFVTTILASFAAYVLVVIYHSAGRGPWFNGLEFGANLVFLSCFWLVGFWLAVNSRSASPRRLMCLMFVGHIAVSLGLQLGHDYLHHELYRSLLGDLSSFAFRSLVLATVAATLWLASQSRYERTRSKLALWAGDISYPLYLVHFPIFIILWRSGARGAVPLLGLAIIAAVIVALIFEWPIRHIRSMNKPSAIPA